MNLFQILALEVADQKPEIRNTLQGILRKARESVVNGINEAIGRTVPEADLIASMLLSALDGISIGVQINADDLSLDQVFREMRRLMAFMVASRLRPELAALFDDPPESLLLAGAAEEGDDDERSGQSER
jgi:hypothetical protein